MTLGERLKANIIRVEHERIAREARSNTKKLAAEIQRKQEIRDRIEILKKKITDAILAGLVWAPVKLPGEWGIGLAISHAQHPDNHLWYEFEEWAEDQGLCLECAGEHDGGEREWYVLKVKPISFDN